MRCLAVGAKLPADQDAADVSSRSSSRVRSAGSGWGRGTGGSATPVAGKKLVFTLAVNRSDTGAPLTTGTMICDLSVAGKELRHADSFTNGTARSAFVVPKTAKGKQLKVKVTINAGAQSATKLTTFKVR